MLGWNEICDEKGAGSAFFIQYLFAILIFGGRANITPCFVVSLRVVIETWTCREAGGESGRKLLFRGQLN